MNLFYPQRSITLLLVTLFLKTTHALIRKKEKIQFQIKFETDLDFDNNLFAYHSEIKTHHNFSNFITGILAGYEIETKFHTIEKDRKPPLYFFEVENFQAPGYKRFVEDYLNLQFTGSRELMLTCEEYFSDRCKNYLKSEIHQTEVMDNLLLLQKKNWYFFNSFKKQEETYTSVLMEFVNKGSVLITFFQLTPQLFNSIMIIFGVWIIILFYDYCCLLRKRKELTRQIESFKDKKE